MSKGTVLVMASVADTLQLRDGKSAAIGVYLNEMIVPSMALVDAGFDLVLATPTGGRPVLDPQSQDASHFGGSESAFKKAVEFFDTYPAMKTPVTLHSLVEGGLDRFAAVFVPGGHAPVVDLSQNEDAGAILRHFHEAGKPTALLCHGPITLISAVPEMKAFRAALEKDDMASAKSSNGGWPYAGYEMTIFSDDEEKYAEEHLLHGKMKFYPVEALKAAGGVLTSNKKPFDPHVTRDRELITGQNPSSDHPLAKALIEALTK